MRINFTVLAVIAFLIFLITSNQARANAVESPCPQAAKYDQQAICQADRSASAAELLNEETKWGIIVSAIGTAALLATIFYSRKATLAATEAVNAAKQALEHSREATLKELRPYMVVSGQGTYGSWIDQADKIDFRNFNVTWINHGKTPAVHTETTANYAIFCENIPADFDFPNHPYDDFRAGAVGPECTLVTSTENVPMDSLREVAQGNKRLFLWSWIEYEAIGGSQRFRTEALFEILLPTHIDPSSREYSPTYMIRSRFSGLDDACFRKPAKPFSSHKGR